MARSSVLALLACAGCDLVFGVNGQPSACELAPFDDASATDITAANDYSIDWQQTLLVYMLDGMAYEVALPDPTPTAIDLGAYQASGFSLTPEGNALFFTAMIEPPMLLGALRAGTASWATAPAVPRGTFAGTPSADVFGPRRVLVRVRPSDADVQEFEDDSGRWIEVGEPFAAPGTLAPNLTPDGLTMVWSGADANGEPAVLAASRADPNEPFGEPIVLLSGAHHAPQLLDKCKQLYSVSEMTLRRRDR